MTKHRGSNGHSERGSARLKFIIVLVISIVIIYVGYMYVPVAYGAYQFKDVMQTKVDACATQGYNPSWATDQLVKSEADYGVPADAVITSTSRDGRIEVRVQFTHPISFPGYTYHYVFDETVRSSAFFNVK